MSKPILPPNYNNPYEIDNEKYMDLFKETKQKENVEE